MVPPADDVTLTAQNVDTGERPTWTATVVGSAIFPNVGYRGVDPPRLGRGVAMDDDELRERSAVSASPIALVDIAAGTDLDAFVAGHPDLPTGDGSFGADWVTDLEPVEIRQAIVAVAVVVLPWVGRVRRTPAARVLRTE